MNEGLDGTNVVEQSSNYDANMEQLVGRKLHIRPNQRRLPRSRRSLENTSRGTGCRRESLPEYTFLPFPGGTRRSR